MKARAINAPTVANETIVRIAVIRLSIISPAEVVNGKADCQKQDCQDCEFDLKVVHVLVPRVVTLDTHYPIDTVIHGQALNSSFYDLS